MYFSVIANHQKLRLGFVKQIMNNFWLNTQSIYKYLHNCSRFLSRLFDTGRIVYNNADTFGGVNPVQH